MQRVQLGPSLRLAHWYIIGGSGSGKTTFLKNILLDDARRGHGFCFIDLHGDAPYELLGSIPEHRLQDVIYYDPTSPFAPAFNFLKLPYEPDKISSDLTALFKMFSEGSWGPRLADILTNSLMTLLYDMRDNGTPRTLLDLRYFLVDDNFRHEVISGIRRPAIQEFWRLDYPKLDRDMVNPVLNKLGQFLAPESMIRRVFSEPENEINFREIMDKKKILLVRLARGKTGDDAARVLGSVFIRGIQQAALSREDTPEDDRIPFFLIVDEFENFAPEPFESILAETRKYKVYLTLAHQGLHQTKGKLKEAVFTNTKVYFTFMISDVDAHVIVREMPGTREEYRVHGKGKFKPIEKFISSARNHLKERYQRYKNILESTPPTSWEISWYKNMLRDIADALDTLEDPDIEVDALSEISQKLYGGTQNYPIAPFNMKDEAKGIRLFADIIFRELPYPSVPQLVKLPPFKTFCRVKGVCDPFLIERTNPAPNPDESIRQAILSQHQRRYEERMQRRQSTNEHHRHTPPPTDRPKKKKPKDDDDFLN